ncbi:hypothetical protein MRBLMI12_000511 [Microbacterium sp. LMI12-1-1.1]|uniref:phage tail tube protein n=1 Tax=Microbacterium sp. LMI12-1-1.1 TaxID=3135225 RepID=UPI0034481B61
MTKVLPGYERLILIPAVEIDGVPWMISPTAGLVDYENPGSAILNEYLAITKPSQANAAQGGNISCVVLDDLNLGVAGSDTDSSKTLCSKGNSEELTFYNFNAELNAKRDENITADSTENLFRDLTRAPDVAYFIGHSVVGQYDSTELAAIGQEWDFYYVHTDIQVPGYSDNEHIQAQSSFVPKNVVNVGHTLGI